MTTSGSFDWQLSRDEIIAAAFQKIGTVQAGDVPTAAQYTHASGILNAMVKSWQNDGVFLWTVEWVTKTFAASAEVTGTDGLIYTCIRSHTSSADNCPESGADWSTVWRLRGTTGGVWVTGTSYQNIGDFAVQADTIGIDSAMIRRSNYADLPLKLISMKEYLAIPDKTVPGLPTVLAYQSGLSPNMFLWPIPNNTTQVLHVLRVRMLEDFDATANNADFPVRWLKALIYGLAYDLGDDYQVPSDKSDRIGAKAKSLFDKAKNKDRVVADDDFIAPAFPE